MGGEGTHAAPHDFLCNGSGLFDACQPLLHGQGSGKEKSLKDWIDSITIATLHLDGSLSDKFIKLHQIFGQNWIGILSRNNLHQNISLRREEIMDHQTSALILHLLKNLFRFHMGRVGGKDRCLRTDLLTLIEDLMFKIHPLKGSLDHKIGI